MSSLFRYTSAYTYFFADLLQSFLLFSSYNSFCHHSLVHYSLEGTVQFVGHKDTYYSTFPMLHKIPAIITFHTQVIR